MGFPGMQYGAPPGWYPPGQGFPYPPQGQLPGQFYAPQPPIGSTAQQQAQPGPQGPQSKQAVPTATATADLKEEPIASQQEDPEKPVATVKLPSTSTTPAPVYPVKQPTPPPPPTDSKPDVAAALAPPAAATRKEDHAGNKPTPIGPKSGRIMPAVPRLSPAVKTLLPVNGTQQPKPVTTTSENEKPITKIEPPRPSQNAKKSLDDANRDARAAVAAAMAKLSPAPGQKKQQDNENIVDNLAKKVNEMRTNDNIRTSRQAGSGGNAAGHRGGRGGYRGGRSQDQQNHRVEVPATDYDFVSANAKFNKQDLVKEAIATGSTIGSPIEGAATKENSAASSINGTRNGNQPTMNIPPTAIYNKTSSFFDNISSESKDRDDGNVKKLGGREFRSEEQKKNLETFGQGSVDNGYRGGPGSRGRGRGRGYGRGRGGYTRGRGGYRGRGGNGTVATES